MEWMCEAFDWTPLEEVKSVVRDKFDDFIREGESSNVKIKRESQHFLEISDYQISFAKI